MAQSKHDKLVASGGHGAKDKAPVCFHAVAQPLVNILHAEARALWSALAVMVLDPKIRAFLEINDPKALEQALKALRKPDEA